MHNLPLCYFIESFSQNRPVNIVHSLSNLHLEDATDQRSQLSHSVSLQSFSSAETPNQHSIKGSCRSRYCAAWLIFNIHLLELFCSPSDSCRRPISEPPPPPLPKELPPNVIEECPSSQLVSCKPGISEDAYEIMNANVDNCDNEYLLPNSALKPPDSIYLASSSQENANYEYIQYSQMENQPTNSSDSGSLLSSEFCLVYLVW